MIVKPLLIRLAITFAHGGSPALVKFSHQKLFQARWGHLKKGKFAYAKNSVNFGWAAA